MNKFEPFYIHFCRPRTRNENSKMAHSSRGFTALIQPSQQERKVCVQVTFCSPNDEFSKKEGRSSVQNAESVNVNPRQVPELLSRLRQECGQQSFAGMYDYVCRYML